MASVDTLPFAQPAARPEPVSALKPAPSNPAPSARESGEASFADVLDTEVDSADGASTDTAPADPAAIPAQPAPPPAASANTAAAAIAAMLQAPVVAAGKGDALSAESAVPAIATAADRLAGPAIDTAAAAPPAAQTPPKADISTTALATPAAAAEAATKAGVAQANAPAVALAATATAKPAQPAKSEDAGPDTADAAASVAKPAVAGDATAPAVTPAQTQPVVTPNTAVSDQAALLVAATVKPPAPELSQNAPGSRRSSAPTDITPSTDASAGATKAAGTQSAASGAAPASAASAASGKPNAPAQAAVATSDAVPDIKTDAAAPSTTASTSFADTLAAARGQSPDAARATASSQPQSAPAAVAQVYAKFIERFDGRAQRFEVRLDPAELGRVDVRIEIGADKKVRAVLAAHDSAAMSDLMRGQRALERALSDAGIDLADGGLRFELSGDSGRNLAGGQQRGDSWSNDELAYAWRGFSSVDVGVDAAPADVAAATRSYFRGASRLDLVA